MKSTTKTIAIIVITAAILLAVYNTYQQKAALTRITLLRSQNNGNFDINGLAYKELLRLAQQAFGKLDGLWSSGGIFKDTNVPVPTDVSGNPLDLSNYNDVNIFLK